jgi:hypothetical protein
MVDNLLNYYYRPNCGILSNGWSVRSLNMGFPVNNGLVEILPCPLSAIIAQPLLIVKHGFQPCIKPQA